MVKQWKQGRGTKRVIHQAETMPALAAIRVWGEGLAVLRVVMYADNDAALAALVKGTSSSLPSAKMVSEFWLAAASWGLHVWVDRVPTCANPADEPSRGGEKNLLAGGFRKVRPVIEGLQAM